MSSSYQTTHCSTCGMPCESMAHVARSACQQGHLQCLEAAVSRDPQCVEPLSNTRWQPCHLFAIEGGHIDCVWFLAERAGNLAKAKGWEGAAIAAAMHNQPEILEVLLMRGLRPDTVIFGETAACVAAHHGHNDCLRLLGRFGADVNLPDGKGSTSARLAACHGHLSTLQLLKGLGADLATHVPLSPPTAAARHGHLRCVQYLLSEGADANGESDRELPPLAEAVLHTPCVEALLAAGAIPTPIALVCAAKSKAHTSLRLMLCCGEKVDVDMYASHPKMHKESPLEVAATANDLVGVRMLQAAGANSSALWSTTPKARPQSIETPPGAQPIPDAVIATTGTLLASKLVLV